MCTLASNLRLEATISFLLFLMLLSGDQLLDGSQVTRYLCCSDSRDLVCQQQCSTCEFNAVYVAFVRIVVRQRGLKDWSTVFTCLVSITGQLQRA